MLETIETREGSVNTLYTGPSFGQILSLELFPFGPKGSENFFDEVIYGSKGFEPWMAFQQGEQSYLSEKNNLCSFGPFFDFEESKVGFAEYTVILDEDFQILEVVSWDCRANKKGCHEPLKAKFEHSKVRKAKHLVLLRVEVWCSDGKFQKRKIQIQELKFENSIFESLKSTKVFSDMYMRSSDIWFDSSVEEEKQVMFGILTQLAMLINKEVNFDGLDSKSRKASETLNFKLDYVELSRGCFLGREFIQLEWVSPKNNETGFISIQLPEEAPDNYNEVSVMGYQGRVIDIQTAVYDSIGYWKKHGKKLLAQ